MHVVRGDLGDDDSNSEDGEDDDVDGAVDGHTSDHVIPTGHAPARPPEPRAPRRLLLKPRLPQHRLEAAMVVSSSIIIIIIIIVII
jgi:hypothetical protein